ncbi:MAG: carbohydrate ABC transporter permease [Clostridia bacterium]|nr:carbohydrate ABC transporter permease [Clostridia bacterium]
MSKIKRKNRKINFFTICICVILALYSVSIISVLIWALITSLKASVDFGILGNVLGFPDLKYSADEVRLANYFRIFSKFTIVTGNATYFSDLFGRIVIPGQRVDFFGLIFNTIIYAVVCSFVHSFATMVAGYLCAKFKYKFSGFVYNLLLIVMIIPIIGTGPATLVLLRNLGLYSTYAGMIILNLNCTGMYFFVYYAFMKGLSDTYIEAAEIDGASQLTIFFKIIVPLSSKILFTVVLIAFIGSWNDYQTPLLYYPDKPTLAYGIYYMSNNTSDATYETSQLTQRVAGCMILALPMVLLFTLCQDIILGNLSMGGLKE